MADFNYEEWSKRSLEFDVEELFKTPKNSKSPQWFKAFQWFNEWYIPTQQSRLGYGLGMGCRPCYGKVLQRIKIEQEKHIYYEISPTYPIVNGELKQENDGNHE